MQKDISPEEKLLSIIKGNHDKGPGNEAGDAEAKDSNAEAAGHKDKIDEYLEVFLKNGFLKNTLFDPQILKVFNKYMVIVLSILILYLFADIFFVNPSRKAAVIISEMSNPVVSVPPMRRVAPAETQGYSYYSNRITGKKIFGGSSYGSLAIQEGAESAEEPSSDDIILLGILKGNNPQAIIEDKKNTKTYYLGKGQSTNGIIVEDINEDKVVLEYKGRKITLFL